MYKNLIFCTQVRFLFELGYYTYMSLWLEKGNIKIVGDSVKIEISRDFISDKSIYTTVNRFTKDNFVSLGFDSEKNVLSVFISPEDKQRDPVSIARDFNKSLINNEFHLFFNKDKKGKAENNKKIKDIFLKG